MKLFKNNSVAGKSGQNYTTGWLPPMVDPRDYTVDHPVIQAILKKTGITKSILPANVDLRKHFPPVENQESLGSCTANAAVGMVEYFEKRAFGKHIDGSRLFVYKTTRNLLGWEGDTGAYLRTTMAALALFGLPPETYWPYSVQKDADDSKNPGFDTEPTSFIYGMADNYEALKYYTHDSFRANKTGEEVLDSVKQHLVAGVPSMFGFYGFSSFNNTEEQGKIPFPCEGETPIWGHALVAVGYDDNITIKNTKDNRVETGALLIRNSWGSGWGEEGYGWLPYKYVTEKYALDFWSMVSMKWADTEMFQL